MRLLGVELDAVTMEDLHRVIAAAVADHRKAIVAHHNMHSIYLTQRDARMPEFYRKARCIHADGMALIFLGRLLGLDLRREHRVTYVDWLRPLLAFAARRGFRVFYLGSRPGIAEQAAARLRAEIPALQIATHHGHFDATPDGAANRTVLLEIDRFQPDILMVGMGMPRQEHWILDNFERINASAILTSGACMDYVVGIVPTAPRWMARIGFEWLFRLWSEPSRLWRRYLLEPWFVLTWLVRYGKQGQRPDLRRGDADADNR
jgi:N-acetylglucosaminyldiphosphoundecaprenol N-acetyl-beta-D-mannosaminyltransferase